jgi:uncharacterized protein YfaS (alpha-2-macroglobulin family)
MTARRFDSWETTQETAWSVMALSAWMQQTGDLKPNYTFGISVNDQSFARGEKASAANVRSAYDLRVSVASLLANQTNRIAIQRSAGAGTLYYSAQLKTYLPVEQVKALSRGMFIERTYSLEGDKKNTPITSARVGEQIRVTLTIVVPETLNYVVIEDPIPAGTQSINTSLQTTQRLDPNNPLRYGWGYWLPAELRDDRTVLYAACLPRHLPVHLSGARRSRRHLPRAAGQRTRLLYARVFGRSAGQLFHAAPDREDF